ncbi:MAG: hypothetical protein AB1730_28600 [Myxococcota bacterium]
MARTGTRASLPWLLALVVRSCAYPLTCAGLRVAKAPVHTAFFVSEEGYDAHHVHDMESAHPVWLRAYRPLAAAKLPVHRQLTP